MTGIILGIFIIAIGFFCVKWIAKIIKRFEFGTYSTLAYIVYWAFFVPFIMLFFIPSCLIPITGGLLENYSEGVREGYLTKISHRGVFWKTWEGQIQIGTGKMSALQSPFEFSVVDRELLKTLQENLGNKVRLYYKQWLIMPFWMGSSGYNIVKVDLQ